MDDLDPFSALDAFDDEPAPIAQRSREDRLRAAFELSKQSFHPANELIILEPGWYSSTERPDLHCKMSLKTIDYEISSLYLKQNFSAALALVLAELANIDMDESKEYFRSLLDTGMRCCLQLGNLDDGGRLAELSRLRWAAAPALALLASKIFLRANQHKDALNAVVTALETRVTPKPYIDELLHILDSSTGESSGSRTPSASAQLARAVRARFVVGKQRPFPFLSRDNLRPAGEQHALVPAPTQSSADPSTDEDVLRWCQGCVDDEIALRLFAILATTNTEDAAEAGRRSVREL
ncbi:hypothetical protein BKA62DRAFT_686458 [Auriculariales sp. MPI-PUGE-AT-0066]|nr:hypothetical protein BKA62DRAFT_686458 [Auriculariales sp. MPI-PUGE-AT-0066]